MRESKYYAIINSKQETTIVRSWSECQAKTKGVTGMLFKSFKTEEKALNWIEQNLNGQLPKKKSLPSTKKLKQTLLPKDTVVIYVDGSYSHSKSVFAGWGWIAIKNNIELTQNCGQTKNPALSRNIDGEIFATLEALHWAKSISLNKVTIAHDYTGISAWAKGIWKANSEIANTYIKKLQEYSNLEIHFLKIKAHSDDFWNDKADQLAKRGIR